MFVETAILGIILILIFLVYYDLGDSHVRAAAKKIPGPKRIPIVGNFLVNGMPRNGAGMLEMRRKLIEEFGHTSKFWIGNELYVVVSDPDDVEVLLNKTIHLDKDKIYQFFKQWLGSGLLISGGQKWYGRRKAITPAFHFKILERFVDVFNKNGGILINSLKKEVGKDHFDVQPYLSRFTLDIICETAMGVEIQAQQHASTPYVSAVRKVLKHLFDRMRNPFLWNDTIYWLLGRKAEEDKMVNIIHNFTNKIIQEKKSENIEVKMDEENSFEGIRNKTAFLELLLNLSKKPDSVFKTDEDIREEVDTFMFEGHDTTTSALSSIFHVLGKYQDVQEKVYNEVCNFMEGKENMNPSFQDLQDMKYLECVVKEAIRLYPPVPAIARHLCEDISLPSGVVAPKGAIALISLFFLHRNNKYITNPEVFNPDNFLPENATGRHPFAYLPFSAGQRNCIGQKFAMLELKSTIAKVLTKYKIEYPGPEWDIIPNPTLTLQSLNGFHIKLVERTK